MENKLAIVIPFFKINFFEQTLLSLSQQSVKKFNVYIGNDASSDSPEELIEKYNKTGNIYYKRFENNLGGEGRLVEQWERCIELSLDEDWIMILADDDYVSENFVEEFYKNIEKAEKEGIQLLRFKMRRVSEKDDFLVDLEQPIIHNAVDYVWEDETHRRFLSISENVFSRKVYEEKGFRNYPLAWRIPMMMYLDFTNAGKVLGINTAFVSIRRSDQQLSWRKDLDMYKKNAMKMCYFDILNEYEKHFSNAQNLRFLKVYAYYSNKGNRLKYSFSSLYLKYGGVKEWLKFNLKNVLNKK